MLNPTMMSRNSIHGAQAECFITIMGRRYNYMSLHDFEATYEVNVADVPILGRVNMGHKAAGGNITWSGTAHYNQSTLRMLLDVYQKTGVMGYFEIQVTNFDPSSTVGRQTIILRDCLCDSLVLTKFAAGEEILDEEISGTAESWEIPEKFLPMPGV